MIDGLFNQTNYQAAKKLLDATMLRHEAIANNLANIETPNFKRQDVAPTFQKELGSAMASRDPLQLRALSPHIVTDEGAVSGRRDGNTVDLEKELLALNKNSAAHALETQLITGNLLKLRLAITGRG